MSSVISLAEYRAARQRCDCGNSACDYGATAEWLAARARRIGTLEELDAAVSEILDLWALAPNIETFELAKALAVEADAMLLREMLDAQRAVAVES